MKTEKRFKGLFGFVAAYPRVILVVALLGSLFSVVYTAKKMEFLTGRDDLMPKNTGYHQDYRNWRQEFGDMDDIVIVIESADQERAARFGTALYEKLAADEQHFQDVFYPFGLEFFKKNGLLFMPAADVKGLRENLTALKPVLKELSASPSVQTLFTYLTGQIDGYVAKGSSSPGAEAQLGSLTFMLEKLGIGFKSFGDSTATPPSLEEFFFQGKDGQESSFSKAGKMQVITALPVKNQASFVPAEEAIKVIRAHLAELRKQPQFKGVSAGLTGNPVLEHEEMSTSQSDITLATIVSLILTVILLLVAFRGVLNVVAAMVSLVVAICLSFGFATLAIGHLNILSMVFAIMLIGIGIEYGIQLVLRYQEELTGGAEPLVAIETGVRNNVWAIIMAAATVAAAFLTFIFTDFKGIAELGIIAAGGVAICVIITFTVLPAMLVVLARYRKIKAPSTGSDRTPHSSSLTESAKQLLFGHPKAVVAISAILCLASLYPLSQITFDYNLMNLQARGLESVRYAYKLMRNSENSGYFAVVTADSAADAAAKTKALESLPTVDHVVSFNSFVPEDQQQKVADLTALRNELSDIKPGEYEEDLSLMELPEVFENFRNAVARLKAKLEQEGKPEAKPVAAFLATLDTFFAKLEKEKDRNAVGMLKDFQGGMFAELPEKIQFLKESLNAELVTASAIPQELRDRFVGKTGRYMLQVVPKHDIFNREPLKAFLDDVRKVDIHATGEPVMVYESMTIMRDSYMKAFVYAFIAIVIILLITFRSIKFALIGLVPLVVGVLFMISGMWLFGINFNSANIIVMPLVLGIAVDSGIYIINRFRREDGSATAVVTSSTGVGVILNTLTIMASFGALMVAHHQGVFSIGAVMSLGMVACQLAFIITLPAVLTLVGKK
ncbi:efflux pump, RND superfamily, putative [Geotalea daltonii FRC-32]|uniref:Efflux pump, RND superfamily, putative n=1 Tax=Geotalea daltonii (strain DSM 22248 / JCM 15807 / FRC-32) TaxID=316067 RepID=B9M6Y1_GEODF|nr:MMPL family transporter [Geotalea daltonii]ACM22002.1 efflux pump, RND superfamily, putative [Geotalea daltonii FRC-32]